MGPESNNRIRVLGAVLFIVNWSTALDDCAPASDPLVWNATDSRQLLLTPGFVRGRYLANLNCNWILKASTLEHRIQISVSYSQIEGRIFTNCDDYIQIYDGADTSARVLASWCGHTYPFAITTSNSAAYIRFKSDAAYELRGANMSFVDFKVPGCPPGWVTLNENCYLLVQKKVIWIEAQQQCGFERSNLLTYENEYEYSQVFDMYSETRGPFWVGLSDAQDEGNYRNVDPVSAVWPDPFPRFEEEGLANKDCIYVDSSQTAESKNVYGVADCRKPMWYICKRNRDGSTVAYPPPEAAIRQGLKPVETGWTPIYLWPLFLAILLILLIILIPYCCMRAKKKARVASADQSNAGLLSHPQPSILPAQPLYAQIQPKVQPGDETVRSVSRIVEQTYGTDEITVQDQKKELNSPNSTITVPVALHQNSDKQQQPPAANGTVAHHGGHGTAKMPLAPLERFDRPYVRMLDNVSAISLDEFWHKMDGSKYQGKKAVPSTTETERTVL